MAWGAVGASTVLGVRLKGILVTGGTAGNLVMRWSQNAISATASTVRQDSYIKAERLA